MPQTDESSDAARFIAAMQSILPEGGRVVMAQFRGDPNSATDTRWRVRVLNDPGMIDERANVYLCVAAMSAGEDGKFRRLKANFAGGLLLMIDDLGDGLGAKFPLKIIDGAPPTALVETSPGNFQAIYMFKEAVTDALRFDALVNAFVAKEFLGKDTGMKGITRIFRPPAGVNGKPKYGGWSVRLAQWNPERRYSVEELVEAFDLALHIQPALPPRVRAHNLPRDGRREEFAELIEILDAAGSIRGEGSTGGWIEIQCPWVEEHSGAVDNGADIRAPAPENDWYGGFQCFHGACEGRRIGTVLDWATAETLDDLVGAVEITNDAAGEFGDYCEGA